MTTKPSIFRAYPYMGLFIIYITNILLHVGLVEMNPYITITEIIVLLVITIFHSSLYLSKKALVKQNEIILKKYKDADIFADELVNASALISKTDEKGKIIYANATFCSASGYKIHELIGRDHNVLTSGQHKKDFWSQMYLATVKFKTIWNDTVVNKTKGGDLYIVNTWIKADFNNSGKHIGFTTVRQDVTELYKTNREIERKNMFLEHSAKILRHDMHSGIFMYIPRGYDAIMRKLPDEVIEKYNLKGSLKLIGGGLKRTQNIYKGVKEFTNLVKKDSVLSKDLYDLQVILEEFVKDTGYGKQVMIDTLPIRNVNKSLFCTAINNLITNGLKYNKSATKWVKIYIDGCDMVVEDNGIGMTKKEYDEYLLPYVRGTNKISGSGLGLNICKAILDEHGFDMYCEDIEGGTKIRIKIN